MNFYTPQDAIDWLRGQVGNLFAARATLQDAYGRALIAQSKTLTPDARARVDQLITDLTTSIQDQNSLENRVRSVLPDSMIPQTLGIFPIIIGIGAIAIAGAVYLHLQRVAEHRHTLDLVEQGVLTPQQAIQMEQSGSLLGSGGLSGLMGNTSMLVGLGLAAYALFLFGPMLSKGFNK